MRELRFSRQVFESLEKLIRKAPEIARVLGQQIDGLRSHPLPRHARRLTGYSYHRIRVGSYRIVYEFDQDTLIITLVEKRDKIYQRLRQSTASYEAA